VWVDYRWETGRSSLCPGFQHAAAP
jgi:hypothetical protein